MTPTTITRADELAKAASALLRDEPLSEAGLLKALAAYRAGRSTDGSCGVNTDAQSLDWLEQLQANSKDEERAIIDLVVHWKWNGKRYPEGIRAAISAARAASGSGEKGK